MNAFEPAASADPSPVPSRERAGQALSSIVDQYGPSLFFEPDRLKLYLDQASPDTPRDTSLILLALAEEVPQQLLAAHSDAELAALVPHLITRLIARDVFDRGSASWVVRIWMHALALPTNPLSQANAAGPRAVPRAVPYAVTDFASVVTPSRTRAPPPPFDPPAPITAELGPLPTRDEVVAPIAAEVVATPLVPPGESVAQPEPAVVESETPIAVFVASLAPIDPVAEKVVPLHADTGAPSPADDRAELPGTEPAPPPALRAEPLPIDAVHDVPDTPAPHDAPIAEAIVAPPDEPVRDLSPVTGTTPTWAVIDSPSTATIVADDPSPHDAETPTSHATMVRAARPGPSRGRSLGIAAAVLVVVAIGWFMATRTDRSAPATTVADAASTGREATREPAAPSPDALPVAPAASMPPTSTTPGETGGASVESVKAPTAAAIVTEPGAAAPVQATPAPTAPQVTQPPAPTPTAEAQPPAIARIDVPRVVAGKPFQLSIRLATSTSSEVTSLEQKVVDSTLTSAKGTTSRPVSSLKRGAGGALLVPMNAIAAASTTTVQFAPVDARGVRGVPQRVTIRVDGAPAAPSATAAACTRNTCGSVASVREFEVDGRTGGRPPKGYELIIRMDDRSIHTLIQTTRVRPGARVRMVGIQFVPIAGDKR